MQPKVKSITFTATVFMVGSAGIKMEVKKDNCEITCMAGPNGNICEVKVKKISHAVFENVVETLLNDYKLLDWDKENPGIDYKYDAAEWELEIVLTDATIIHYNNTMRNGEPAHFDMVIRLFSTFCHLIGELFSFLNGDNGEIN